MQRAFATIRLGADDLDPAVVTTMLGHPPTFGHRRGETFRYGPSSPEQIGKTGVWFLSTNKLVDSNDLDEHTGFIVRLIAGTTPKPLSNSRLHHIRTFVEEGEIAVSASCFWAGPVDEAAPAVSPTFTDLVSRLHGSVEVAFDHDWDETLQRADVA